MNEPTTPGNAGQTLAPVNLFGLTVGQSATLSENDCFGSTCNVVILKIHKGGNVIVQDGNVKREVSASNLKPKSSELVRRRRSCPDCKGRGEIINRIFMDDKYDEPMTCPRCKGNRIATSDMTYE